MWLENPATMEGKKISNINADSTVSREKLYEEVWSEPMTKVALRYKVSGSFLARICTRLNVPRPSRGYWAMVSAGRKIKRMPLPDARPGDELEWSRYGRARVAQFPPPTPISEKTQRVHRRKLLPERHPLLVDARELMLEGKESDNGLLNPRKRMLADIITSNTTLDRALDVANELYLSFERRGHSVMLEPYGQHLRRYSVDEREKGGRQQRYFEPWCPSRSTLVFIGTVAFGLTIFETSENVEVKYHDGKYIRVSDLPAKKSKRYSESYSWTTTHEMPSGRLCVQVYSPYPRVAWMRQWREAKSGAFPRKLSGIAKELESEVATIVRLFDEGERKAEIERQQWEAQKREWEREEAERRRIQAKKESLEQLLNIIDTWAEAKRIEDFFADAERRAADLSDDEKLIILERLGLAREIIGSTDALKRFKSWKAPDER
jgi:hypothetical protein